MNMDDDDGHGGSSSSMDGLRGTPEIKAKVYLIGFTFGGQDTIERVTTL